MHLKATALCLSIIFASGCDRFIGGNGDIEFTIDNPTAAPITVSIDGVAHTIDAHADSEIELKPGAHTLHSENLGDVHFIVYTKGRGGLINPTLGEYVMAREIYVTDEDKLKNFGVGNSEIELDGVSFRGPFNKTHDLFIDKHWNYGTHQPFPEQKTVIHVDKSGGEINTKIFTAPDFIKYVEDSTGEPGAYARQNPKGYTAPTFTLPPPVTELPPLAPPFEAQAKPTRDVYARYLKATTTEQQLALQKEAFNVMMAFRPEGPEVAKLPPAAHEQRNQFVSAFSQAIGSSAIVVPAAQ